MGFRLWVVVCSALGFALTTGCGWQSQQSVYAASPDARLGFSSRTIVQERAAEAKYTAQLSIESISQFHQTITKRPHMAGTPASMAVAETIRQGLESAGLQTEVHEFQVYLSTPRSISVELIEPTKEPLNVREPANALDPDSANPELVPAFVAYSASGEVQAPVVYVNYGLPPDYAKVEAAGSRCPRQDRDGSLCPEPSGSKDPHRAGARRRGHHYLSAIPPTMAMPKD